jgi:uncharacterized protein (DUF362 family)
MGSKVCLVRVPRSSQTIIDTVSNAVTGTDFRFDASIKTVVIKPNLCYYWDYSTGNTTDPKLVAAIIDYVRQECGEGVDIKIAEADASAMRTKYAFPALGYTRLAAEKNVQLVNLSEAEFTENAVTVNGHKLVFKIPQLLVKSDLFINMPKLKVMKATTITCAMKNLFGANGVTRKVKYHRLLNEAIVGINKLLHPHLTVVDGIIALGAYPFRLNLIMAGIDSFSIDWVASRVMGFSPSKIQFLKLAIKEKIGFPKEIVVVGEEPTVYSRVFPRPAVSISNYLFGIQAGLLRAYKKVSGDIIPPALEE